MPHQRIHSYGKTIENEIPLILIIGREPNTDREIDGDHGFYDFDKYPKCAFWNISYSIIGEIARLKTNDFKNECRKKNCSPIIYADSLPIGITHKTQNKNLHRRSLSEEYIKSHINSIFLFTELLDRVSIVIMSGLNKPVFDNAKFQITENTTQRNIEFINLPFFYGNNRNDIVYRLSADCRKIISNVMTTFTEL